MLGGRLIFQICDVVEIHRDDVVETFEVLIGDSSRANVAEGDTPALGCGAGPTIRRITDVIGMRARRIYCQALEYADRYCPCKQKEQKFYL